MRSNSPTGFIERIDRLLAKYDPATDDPNRTIAEVFRLRALQRPRLDEIIRLATRGLRRFPRNAPLLRRRAAARERVATTDGKFPLAKAAASDLQRVLDDDPDNVAAGVELLDHLFRFSRMPDSDVAACAERLVDRAQKTLASAVALQIRALGYANRRHLARRAYASWKARLPGALELDVAWTEVGSTKSRTA